MNLKNRIEKLEDEYQNEGGDELIVYITRFSHLVKPLPGKPLPEKVVLPDPETEIARQREAGRKVIVVDVPYDYELTPPATT